MRRHAFALVAAAALTAVVACSRGRAPARDEGVAPAVVDPLEHLRAFERARRAEARFLEAPLQDRAFGADPYDVAILRDGRHAGILRGRDALVVLDADLREVARVPTPRAPSALAVYDGAPAGRLRPGDVLVTSELEPVLAHYRPRDGSIDRLPDVDLGDVLAARDVATGPEGVVYVVEEHDDRLLSLSFSESGIARRSQAVPRGPLRVVRTRSGLFVMSLLAHEIAALRVDRGGLPTGASSSVKIDGPFWGLDAVDTTDGALLLAGGVEDHPLDRRGGFFGWIDSYVYVLRWRDGELARLAAIDVAEHGLIVPKAMAFAPRGDGPLTALVTSYGAPLAARLVWRDGPDAPPAVEPAGAPPGASAIAHAGGERFVAADPLLDAWLAIDDGGARVVRAEEPGLDRRTERERLGEALFFTGLMAPSSTAEGAKSRFSCETCHFEGYVDGRVHHTGRGDVRATTKPLVGLFANRPHFSRALDPDLSAVAENEFRVAGAPSLADPHFDLDARDAPWLADMGLTARRWDAAELRLSLMSFLMVWNHRTNPSAARARAFTPRERDGALAFRDRCERCHQARAAADDPGSRVPFERWEPLVLGGGPIVWASDAYEKTGVEPYVHERGARVPSLRRLYKKRPYFTNGSAPDLVTVLRTARFRGDTFLHAGGAADDERLDEPTIAAIASFLDLL